MNPETYSTYEAKSRLSELLRKVRDGRIVQITYHGQPIAEVRPIAPPNTDLENKLKTLEEQGILVRRDPTVGTFIGAAERPGALERFLKDRD